ncbi:MAG: sel1 repeat family protein [Victivallales bacterium]|nr:sel1 repeat family protein [Victivallales bacterium]
MPKMLPVLSLLIFYCGCICSNGNTVKPTSSGKEAISSMKDAIDNNGKECVYNYNKEEGMNMTMDQILDELYAAGKECLRERSFLYSPWERSDRRNEYISRFDKAIFACLDIPARNGHALAAFRLAQLCSEPYSWKVYDPSRADELKTQAMANMVKQVEAKPSLAFDAGFAYLYESGSKDIQNAERYFQIGADTGDASCIWQLGEIAKMTGQKERAFQYFLKAAKLGQGMAMFEVAECFKNGEGTPVDKDEAIHWYKLCVESKYAASSDAENRLKELKAD